MRKATPIVVIAFTLLYGIVWALNGPVFLAMVPRLILRRELKRAIAMNSIQFNMACLCRPMPATAIIAVAGSCRGLHSECLHFYPALTPNLVLYSEYFQANAQRNNFAAG